VNILAHGNKRFARPWAGADAVAMTPRPDQPLAAKINYSDTDFLAPGQLGWSGGGM